VQKAVFCALATGTQNRSTRLRVGYVEEVKLSFNNGEERENIQSQSGCHAVFALPSLALCISDGRLRFCALVL
jgi:hypothetical protein